MVVQRFKNRQIIKHAHNGKYWCILCLQDGKLTWNEHEVDSCEELAKQRGL